MMRLIRRLRGSLCTAVAGLLIALVAACVAGSSATLAQVPLGGVQAEAPLNQEQVEKFASGAKEVAGLSDAEIIAALYDRESLRAIPVRVEVNGLYPGTQPRVAAETAGQKPAGSRAGRASPGKPQADSAGPGIARPETAGTDQYEPKRPAPGTGEDSGHEPPGTGSDTGSTQYEQTDPAEEANSSYPFYCGQLGSRVDYYNVNEELLASFKMKKFWCWNYSAITYAPSPEAQASVTPLGEQGGWKYRGIAASTEKYMAYDSLSRGAHRSYREGAFDVCTRATGCRLTGTPQIRITVFYNGRGLNEASR